MGFGDLAVWDQANATAAVFGDEESYKEIVAVDQAGALVDDTGQLEIAKIASG